MAKVSTTHEFAALLKGALDALRWPAKGRGRGLHELTGMPTRTAQSYLAGEREPLWSQAWQIWASLGVDPRVLSQSRTDVPKNGPGRLPGHRSGRRGTLYAPAATMLAKRISEIITETLERQELTALSQAALIATMLEEMANFLQTHGVPKEALQQMRDFAQDLVDGKFG